MISRWRKKDKESKGSSSSFLPSSYHHAEPATLFSPRSPTPSAYTFESPAQQRLARAYHNSNRSTVPGHIRPVTCSNFLMGGQYYPGKDKKRNFLRRKTLWHRIFCSSKIRMVASITVCTYFLVVCMLIPTLDVIHKYGHMLSKKGPTKSTLVNTFDTKVQTSSDHTIAVQMEEGNEIKMDNGQNIDDGVKNDDHDFGEEEQAEIENVEDVKRESLIEEALPNPAEINSENQNPVNENGKSNDILNNIKPTEELKLEAQILDQKFEEMQNEPSRTKERNEVLNQMVPEFNDENASEIKGHEEMRNNLIIKNSNDANDHIEKMPRTLFNKDTHHQFSSCPKAGVKNISVTLVIQTTFDRIKLLYLTCKRLNSSSLIVSVYLTQDEYHNEWDGVKKEYENLCNNVQFVPYISKSNEERTLSYPINSLRNKALDLVTSSHVLVIDIDMIPSENLDEAILESIDLAIERRADDDGDAGIDPHDAIVVPAFERKLKNDTKCGTLEKCHDLIEKDQYFIPKNMKELKEKIVEEECIIFQSENNWEGHHSTNTKQWIQSSKTLRTIDCFDSLRYEPYVIIPWCALKSNAEQMIMKAPGPRSPYYDERFFGYGKNKIQQIAHLRRRGYHFMVMPPTGYLTHFPHPISSTKKIWNDKKSFDLHAKMDKLYPRYLDELDDVYERIFVETKLCKN